MNSALPIRLSVRDPSSMMRQVMWPSLSISPDFAETKFMGRLGVVMSERARRASSSIFGWDGMDGLLDSRWKDGGLGAECTWVVVGKKGLWCLVLYMCI